MSSESPGGRAPSSRSRAVLLICPPVGPFHAPGEIEAWIAELAAKRRRYAGDPGALEAVAAAERDAARMLALSRQDRAARGTAAGESPPPAG